MDINDNNISSAAELQSGGCLNVFLYYTRYAKHDYIPVHSQNCANHEWGTNLELACVWTNDKLSLHINKLRWCV